MRNKEEKGITLIALIITIIILLILAGVTITMLTGDNGILKQATNARKINNKAEFEEQVKLAIMVAKTNETGKINLDDLYTELKKIYKVIILKDGKEINDGINDLPWTVTKDNNSYIIDEEGTVTKADDKIDEDIIQKPGLYDANDKLLADWNTLVDTYGLSIETDYSFNNYKTSESSIYYLLNNNADLISGNKLIIDSSVTKIGNYAFRESDLENIIISNSVTTIGLNAFYQCDKLINISIPNSVVTINAFAFTYCEELVSIDIPESVTNIGAYTFKNCKKLKAINVTEENSKYSSENGILFSKEKKEIIKYPEGKNDIEVYSIPSTVQIIRGDSFYNCSTLNKIELPVSIKNIGNAAFENCTELTSIMIPDGITQIENSTFSNCNNLKDVGLPETITNIGSSAFKNCTELTNIIIPDKVIEISNEAFFNCKNLKQIIIPQGVTNIEKSIFHGCTNLTSVNIKGNVINIQDTAFVGCVNLSEIEIPNSLKTIGMAAFANCQSLKKLKIPDSVTTIGMGAFSGILKVIYNGTATGSPWGATEVVANE